MNEQNNLNKESKDNQNQVCNVDIQKIEYNNESIKYSIEQTRRAKEYIEIEIEKRNSREYMREKRVSSQIIAC